MSVLKIKNEFGEWEDITSIRGADGKDGAIQYQAGKNISLENNTISTSALNENEVQDLIDASIETLGELGFTPTVVEELPTEDIDEHTIYLVPKTGETGDVYDEYVYINNAWEHIGSTAVDLSNYATKEYVNNDKHQVYRFDLNATYFTEQNFNQSEDLTRASELINYCYQNNLSSVVIASKNIHNLEYIFSTSDDLTTQRTMYIFHGTCFDGYTMRYVSFRITGKWNNDVFTSNTLTSFKGTFQNLPQILMINNTTAYVPTSDYNPATKKYVDDSIAAIPTGSDGDSIPIVELTDQDYDGMFLGSGITINDDVRQKFTDLINNYKQKYFPDDENLNNGRLMFLLKYKSAGQVSSAWVFQNDYLNADESGSPIKFSMFNSYSSEFGEHRIQVAYLPLQGTWDNGVFTCTSSGFWLPAQSIRLDSLVTTSETGELYNLQTDDKSNLVAAINEIANSSGGSYPVYTLQIDDAAPSSWDWRQYTSDSVKEQGAKIVKDILENQYFCSSILVNTNDAQLALMVTCNKGNYYTILNKSQYCSLSFQGVMWNSGSTARDLRENIDVYIDATRDQDTGAITCNNVSISKQMNTSIPTRLYLLEKFQTEITGYDASKTQVLKNVNGKLTWVDE